MKAGSAKPRVQDFRKVCKIELNPINSEYDDHYMVWSGFIDIEQVDCLTGQNFIFDMLDHLTFISLSLSLFLSLSL